MDRQDRNSRTPAIVLKAERFGEIHKNVTIFTPEQGILRAVAHGAYKGKSRLSGVTEPFNLGEAVLYHNPVKDSYKLTDYEPVDYLHELRGDLKRFYHALLWAEIAIKTNGGGAYPEFFALLAEALPLMARGDDKAVPYLQIQVLSRMIHILGFSLYAEFCASCEREMTDTDTLVYDARLNAFVCSDCSSGGPFPSLSAGARRYLNHTERLPLDQAVKVALASASAGPLLRVLFGFVQDTVETPLKTLKTLQGGFLL